MPPRGRCVMVTTTDLGCTLCITSVAITDAGPGRKIQRKATKRSDWRDVPLTFNALAAMRSQRDRAGGRSPHGVAITDYGLSNPAGGDVVGCRHSAESPDVLPDTGLAAVGLELGIVEGLRHNMWLHCSL